jgi:hypothetical protein
VAGIQWKAEDLLYRFLDTVGDGSGTKNAVGDYSAGTGTPTSFKIVPPSGELYTLSRVIVQIRDSGLISAEGYGGLAALTNGVELRVRDGAGTVLDLVNGLPVKSNAGWGSFCYDVALTEFGAGDNFVQVRWTFSKSGKALELNGDEGEYLEAYLSDDLTGLVGHTFQVQGFKAAI